MYVKVNNEIEKTEDEQNNGYCEKQNVRKSSNTGFNNNKKNITQQVGSSANNVYNSNSNNNENNINHFNFFSDIIKKFDKEYNNSNDFNSNKALETISNNLQLKETQINDNVEASNIDTNNYGNKKDNYLNVNDSINKELIKTLSNFPLINYSIGRNKYPIYLKKTLTQRVEDNVYNNIQKNKNKNSMNSKKE